MIDDNSKLHLSIVDLGDALANLLEQPGTDCRSSGCAFSLDKRGVRVQGGCRHGDQPLTGREQIAITRLLRAARAVVVANAALLESEAAARDAAPEGKA